MRRARTGLVPLGLALLSACSGNLAKPAVSAVSPGSLGLGTAPTPVIAADWWKDFGDPQLDGIVADALAGNPGLDTALARLEQARAAEGLQQAEGRPQVALDAQEQRTRLSERYIIPPPYGGSTQWVGQVQANLSWSLDFWGKQAAAIRQAQASGRAAALDLTAARLAVAGAVVSTYVDLARADQAIALAKAEISERQGAVRLANVRLRTQLDGKIGVSAAAVNLAQAEQVLIRAEGARVLAIHALARLAGQGAGYYEKIGPTRLQLGTALALPVSLPSDLLVRRPDVAAALARIDAAREGREVARRAFYPNINLLGLVGVQALGLGNLVSTAAATAGAGAGLHLPIFDGGRLRSEHASATAALDAAIADYNATVVGAVQQAADALTNIDTKSRDLAAQRALAAELRETVRLNGVRVASGLDSRLDIVDSRTRELDARLAAANLAADVAVARVRLLLAVGGGFSSDALPDPLSRSKD